VHAVCMEESRGLIRGFLGKKPEGQRQLGRPRRRCDDDIKMDPQEVGWGHGLDRYGSG
jgi:hypothetical protein